MAGQTPARVKPPGRGAEAAQFVNHAAVRRLGYQSTAPPYPPRATFSSTHRYGKAASVFLSSSLVLPLPLAPLTRVGFLYTRS
jgi:hypothetical protein